MANNNSLIALLETRLAEQQAQPYAKLKSGLAELQTDFSRQKFFYLFAICPRWFEKLPNRIDSDTQKEWLAHDRFGVLSTWQYPQLARLFILLRVAEIVTPTDYIDHINQLYKTADVNELILLGQSLAFIPHAEQLLERARESARSNIVTVFSSIAHNSNYAKRFFDESGWNQLILKAAFLAVPIWNIAGLKERNNRELATMLRHYVNERQAASRSVPWDLWCCIAWLAESDDEIAYLEQQWHAADHKTQAAIYLALSENPTTQARAEKLLSQASKEITAVLNWSQLAQWPD